MSNIFPVYSFTNVKLFKTVLLFIKSHQLRRILCFQKHYHSSTDILHLFDFLYSKSKNILSGNSFICTACIVFAKLCNQISG